MLDENDNLQIEQLLTNLDLKLHFKLHKMSFTLKSCKVALKLII
jgi:hypothetical protein